MLGNNLVYKCIFQKIKLNFKSSFYVSYGFFFIWFLFLIGAIFGGIEPILGSSSGDASNVEDNNSCMYSQSFVSDIFFTTQFCVTLKKKISIFVSHLLLWLECYLSQNYNLTLPTVSSLSCPPT